MLIARPVTAVSCILALSCVAPCMPAELASGLDGVEMLCELDKSGPGPQPPGIWAVEVPGGARRILTYASRPVWSPDRRRFAFVHDGQVCVASVTDGSHQPLERYVEAAGSVPHSMLYEPQRHLMWSADSARLVSFGWAYTERDGPLWAAMYLLGAPAWPPTGLVINHTARHVGAVALLRNGTVIYESFDWLPGLGVSDIGLRTWTPSTDEDMALNLQSAAGDAWTCNPTPSPDGRYLALDVVSAETRRRHVYVHDFLGESSGHVELGRGMQCAHAVEWGPDSRRLLVIGSQDPAGIAMSFLHLVAWGDERGRAGNTVLQLPGAMPVHQAVFSPDGRHVGVLAGGGVQLEASTLAAEVDIISPTTGVVRRIDFPGYLRPVAIDW